MVVSRHHSLQMAAGV
jgi:hypothetical protein